MKRIGLPRFIAIEPCRKDAVEICTGADEEKDDQEKGLEFEDAEHCEFASNGDIFN